MALCILYIIIRSPYTQDSIFLTGAIRVWGFRVEGFQGSRGFGPLSVYEPGFRSVVLTEDP